ncbi:MAG: hypothetical protein LBT27_04185, partial [Prevotellaceae bacterium]|nr:hypothetical protein [Prevotellaceae bacterium]
MIKKFNWLLIAAITIMMSSCTADDMKNSYNQGMVDFTVKTAIPHGITTYASHNGGATNVSSTYYNLRYILEAWTKESPPRLAYRGYRIVQNNFTGTSVDFTARLLALEYDFVFWADFVDASVTAPVSGAGAGDLYYKTNDGYTDAQLIADPTLDKGLTDILLRQDALAPAYNVSDEARDAFYAVKSVDLRTTSQIGAVTLYRPFGKFRLVSLDVVDGYLSTTPILKSKIEYTGTTDFPAGFNAQTGAVNTSVTIDLSAPLTSGIETETAVVGGVNYPNASILALDYIFAAPTQTAA